MRIAVCGGVYSNPYALKAFCADARSRGADRLFCLGDLGGYGAEPDAIWSLLRDNDITCVAGNYDVAIAAGGDDCGCGYRDPRDQQYAQVMYDYTLAHTSREFANWMGTLPIERRETLGGCDVHFVHGSTLANNDFWWESLNDDGHALRIAESGADVILATHSGLPWQRQFDGTLVVNVGVVGRPANDGASQVCYALVDLHNGHAEARIIPLSYDWRAQARSMRRAGLPEPFVATTETGWWTTCLEILPIPERSRGRYHIYDSTVPEIHERLGLAEEEWPTHADDLPVRSLVGSPLLPDRIWVDDRVRRTPELVSSAAAIGIHDVRLLTGRDGPNDTPLSSVIPAPRAELTLARDGWYWHPCERGEDPLAPIGAPLHDALATTVHHLFGHLADVGALIPPRHCVA